MAQDTAPEVTSEQIQRGTQAALEAIEGFKSHGVYAFEEETLRGAVEIIQKMETDRALLELIYTRQVKITYANGEMVVSLIKVPTNSKGPPSPISPEMVRWAHIY